MKKANVMDFKDEWLTPEDFRNLMKKENFDVNKTWIINDGLAAFIVGRDEKSGEFYMNFAGATIAAHKDLAEIVKKIERPSWQEIIVMANVVCEINKKSEEEAE